MAPTTTQTYRNVREFPLPSIHYQIYTPHRALVNLQLGQNIYKYTWHIHFGAIETPHTTHENAQSQSHKYIHSITVSFAGKLREQAENPQRFTHHQFAGVFLVEIAPYFDAKHKMCGCVGFELRAHCFASYKISRFTSQIYSKKKDAQCGGIQSTANIRIIIIIPQTHTQTDTKCVCSDLG